MGRTIGLGRIWSFVLGFRSLVAWLAPFKRESEQRGRMFWQWKVWTANFSATMVRQEVWREKRKVRFFGKGKCELTAIVRIFGMGKCKLIANFSATMMTSLPSISLSLCISLSLSVSLSLSLSLSHRAYLTHNIGSASTLPIMNYRKGLAKKKNHMSPGLYWHTRQFCHIFTPVDQLFLHYPALKLTYFVQWALYCTQHYDICLSPGWLHEVQWVLCTTFWTIHMTGVYACLCEAVCDVTTVPRHLSTKNYWK